ncbi:unnamed protein product [Clavelina lepadiformis]|uniref:Ras GTPase-activating protein nGAP n=1 Tax=Clavelina lepadiformis TaxID=159417 RepID=A0ABP0F8Q2_CLALP
MAAASYSQLHSSDIFTQVPDVYGGCRRKSFEAEDGPAIFRTLSAPHKNHQRYSLNIQPARIRDVPPDLPGLHGSSVSLIGGDFLNSESVSLPRCSSDSNFLPPSTCQSSTEVKRNHSLKTFLQRKIPPAIRRTKSSKATQGKENRPLLDMTSLMAQSSNLRNTEVELPFFMPAIESPDAIDLSNCSSQFQDGIVRPLHHSILGRDHCFEVVANETTRCFACESAGEREAWIEKIKRAINPNLDNMRRVEHQLILFVQEAKGLPTKKKYFCEICLDRKLCARTTSKWKNDSAIFWGEHFEFSSMPDVRDVTVHLYKDSDKKKKKDKDYIGLVNLEVRSLINQSSVEKWYNLSTPSGNNKSKTGESMALRIKARFLSTRVLPTEQYKAFGEHISLNYLNICRTLGNVIPVTKKDEIARILVHIMHGTGCTKEYMTEVVMDEVEKVEEESLIFRENTIGTKSVEAMLRLVGMKYLYDTLGDFVHALFNMEEECEVDGSRLPPQANLEVNQKNLHMSCEIALCKITNSVGIFPSELREVMASWRVRCEDAGRPRIANRLVTASLFLRLLCPAILNPSLFGLANEVPDPKISRILTLIAKVIQNLANRSRFDKEEYMQFMDKFIREKWDDMGEFINNVSDPTLPPLHKGFQGFIDLGKEFAKLHAFFVELMPTLDKKTIDALGELPDIIDKVSESLENPGKISSPYSTPKLERPDLTQIVEDVALTHDADQVRPAGCSNTPMIDRRNRLPSSAATSLLNLREFVNAAEDGQYDVPSTTANAYTPSHHGSHHSIPNSNNNNAGSHGSVRQTLSSTENLMTSSGGKQYGERPPLMFSNPAYQAQKGLNRSTPASVPAMHDTFNIQQSYDGQKQHSKKNNPTATAPARQSDVKNHAPLSFSNPLQAMSQQRHLETVFTTETVTYSAPTRFVVDSSPGRSYSGPRGPQRGPKDGTNSMSSDGSQSNVSSLSSRQSSTSTNSLSDAESPQPTPYHARDQQRRTPNSTASKSREGRSEMDGIADSQLLMSVETISTSVSNAHLKTGLQSQNQRGNKSEDIYKPQPKPRNATAQLSKGGSSFGGRKTSVPCLSPKWPHQGPRRGSADNIKSLHLNEEGGKYPSFHLKVDQEAILELNETTDAEMAPQNNRQGRNKAENSPVMSKDPDGFVTAPVTAVKSRVVVATSNANRVKTSKHAPTSNSQSKSHHNQSSGQARRGSHQKGVNQGQKNPSHPVSDSPAAFPPNTPEGPLSPEARTAQWILNNVSTPSKDLKQEEEMEVVLTPKDYEDRIIRLETEVERLRARETDVRRNVEQKEATLIEKLRNSEKREAKYRRQTDEKEQHFQKALQQMAALEADHKRERVELQAMLDSKDCMVNEQQKRINKLERKLHRLERSNPRPDPNASNPANFQRNADKIQGGPLSYIDDDADPNVSRGRKTKQTNDVPTTSATVTLTTDPYCNGQFYLHGLSSTSPSPSSSV